MKLIIDIADDQYKAVQDGMWCGSLYEELRNGIPVEQCGDCIRRQDVEDAIYDYSRSCDVNYAQIMEFIDKLPSVTPQPKMGHWEKDEYGNIHCTFCGCNALYEKIHYPDGYFGKVVRARSGFCPTCGAKMQEVRYGE